MILIENSKKRKYKKYGSNENSNTYKNAKMEPLNSKCL